MGRGLFSSRIAEVVNDAAAFLINAPVIGKVFGRGLVVIRYVGRRSGKTFETPVGYRRSAGSLVIGVMAPDAKNWWRNFLGEGAPITLLNFNGNGTDRSGHAIAKRDGRGRVSVTVQLDD
jgi:hypothetical protein